MDTLKVPEDNENTQSRTNLNASCMSDHPEQDDLWYMSKQIFGVAIPFFLTQALIYVFDLMVFVFIGQKNDINQIAGLGLAFTYYYAIEAPLQGLNMAMGVLVPIAVGQKNIKKCEILLTRGRIVASFAFLFMLPPIYRCREILTYVGVDKQIAEHCYTFLTSFIVGIYINNTQIDVFRQFLLYTNQGDLLTKVWVTMAVVQPIFLGIFVYYFDLGIAGAGYGYSFTMIVGLCLVSYLTQTSQSMPIKVLLLEKVVLQDIGAYLAIGIPSAILTCIEWWTHDSIVFMASLLSPLQLSAQSIANNWFYIQYSLPWAFQIASNAFVGKSIGQQKKERAQTYAKLSVFYSFAVCLVLGLFIQLFVQQIAQLYTTQHRVVSALMPILNTLSYVVVLQGVMLSLQGTLKSLRLQSIAILIMILGYYTISIPMAYYMTFELKIPTGLWEGFLFGPAIVILLYTLLTVYVDWNRVLEAEAQSYKVELEMIKLDNNELKSEAVTPQSNDLKESQH